MQIHWSSALIALSLAACDRGVEQPQPAADAISTGSSEPAAVSQCKVCHTFQQGGPDRLGPNLWDIYGKQAAADTDFAYSTALRNSGLVWDDASLDAYLTDPQQTVPGGKMSFAGLKGPAERKAVIEFLATLTPEDLPE